MVFDDVGITHTNKVNPNTAATLINNTNENGDIVLISELRITVQSQFLNSSVTCVNTEAGTAYIARIQVIGTMCYFTLIIVKSGHVEKTRYLLHAEDDPSGRYIATTSIIKDN